MEYPTSTREFRLDELLTIISGVVFIDYLKEEDHNDEFTRRIGNVLQYLTGESQLQYHQFPRISVEVTAYLATQCPEVADLITDMPDETTGTDAEIKKWYENTKPKISEIGSNLVPISPIAPIDHTPIDSETEIRLKGGTIVYIDI